MGQELGHWGHFWLVGSNSRRCHRVHNEERHLEDRLALEDGLLAFFCGCKCCQETHVVEQVVLEQSDVFFILANRRNLGVQVFNGPLLHQFLCDFSRHSKGLE